MKGVDNKLPSLLLFLPIVDILLLVRNTSGLAKYKQLNFIKRAKIILKRLKMQKG